ncbi:energy-coupling factor ABC transporter ATP-binding protein [Metabacillus fastidiosus]|uniref:Energy-coupling factor transporter ATP-binding protein EcfA2 n=1 Tax=Metabacillus fastidiosus TaxID=1458 RepID=A0ABU6P104_9BACI|nr:energy-coupling factor ABC transporter ATP-binding protein [Metabacillus fastidiosus]MED4402189.1 energy-coupling factor ABC transporter ATP-binding protein [Metabacillus fastidiosus]MED4464818.1 energy-coupling factor ABC transporter ATP-binding protein [Metabacillus fastidiosus]
MDIEIKELEHRYQVHSPFERLALYDVNITVKEGTYLAIIGHTGSGKSTLLQHLNGLLKPTRGTVKIGDYLIKAGKKQKDLKAIRKHVGIVFQFPEHQLFEETVEKDIAFGPINFGVSREEAKQKVREALASVGLSENILEKSPFELSGGQMRRVAIAGVLAMEPEILILDEPTAGLDPKGRSEIMDLFYQLHKERNGTTILVTHSMEDAAKYADEIAVMHEGTMKLRGTPQEIFQSVEELHSFGLDLPQTLRFQHELERTLQVKLEKLSLTADDIVEQMKKLMYVGEKS